MATATIDKETGEITEAEGRTIRPFTDFLQEHRHGELHGEVSAALNDLVQAVTGIGKSGSLTLTITIEPAGTNHEQVLVKDDVVVKQPKPARESAICFVDDEGNLSRRDPRQPELPGLRTVASRPASEAKSIEKEVAN